MRGDFSRWGFDPKDNRAGVLYQQGRAWLDGDANAATLIQDAWNQDLARDVIGAGVAAVPAGSGGFKVLEASSDGVTITVKLQEGRAWVDGVPLVHGGGSLHAPYLGLPVQAPAEASSIGPGVRDAVVLEAWEEELSAFQDPAGLLEPALGGPDTTERIQRAYRLRLYRLAAGEDCESLADGLRDDPGARGKLTVTPKPEVVLGSDCPVQAGGGFTGFEHALYRIEIASPAGGRARFKWSRYNGGLVGRGRFDSAASKVRITGNNQAVDRSGLAKGYLEALAPDAAEGCWTVVFSAEATWSAEGELSLANPSGAWPAAGAQAFFRLWDGIGFVDDYPAGAPDPVELNDGIRLEFEAPLAGLSNYVERDYWTFPVRAAGVPFDPSWWPQHAAPQGLIRHRAALAVLEWDAAAPVTLAAPDAIHDCRKPFPPLTRQRGCCYRVGDGKTSFGDFDSVETALDHLPARGGELCLLPGFHRCNALIRGRRNIRISGCRRQSMVAPRIGREATPVFRIEDSEGIRIEGLDLVALGTIAIAARGTAPGKLRDAAFAENRILACRHAIRITECEGFSVAGNLIRMLDRQGGLEAVLVQAEKGRIERNDIAMVPAGVRPPGRDPGDPDDPDPIDPCARPEVFYRDRPYLTILVAEIWKHSSAALAALFPADPFQGLGGIRLAGGCEDIHVLENVVTGGDGNGITLGGGIAAARGQEGPGEPGAEPVVLANNQSAIFVKAVAAGQPAAGVAFRLRSSGNDHDALTDSHGEMKVAAAPGTYAVEVASPGYRIKCVTVSFDPARGATHLIDLEIVKAGPPRDPLALAFLRDITIEGNVISEMGLNGIGSPVGRAAAGTKAGGVGALLSRYGGILADLSIHRNRIRKCFRNVLDEAMAELVLTRGLGGISLGICQDLAINENRIQSNGVSHAKPVCGIFIAYANRADIVENRLEDNGPLTQRTAEPRPGQRGGIVILIAASVALGEAPGGAAGANAALAGARKIPKSGYALRVADNSVQQPLGRSLSAMALGPMAVTGNQLRSDTALPISGGALGAAVFLLDFAKPATQAEAGDVLSGGEMLVASNQIALRLGAECKLGVWMAALDDLGVAGNQLSIAGETGLAAHAYALGGTVRVTSNRFQEPDGRSFRLSLLSWGLRLNVTSGNQGDHCMVAVCSSAAHPAVDRDNLQIGGGGDLCGNLKKAFATALKANI
ncbi:MAG TPA: DUF6519 domain-containing protein [Fibrobacteria bacterium]|nr:DUF6519 domain-containing protein [Fibrobacteria bacterium]